MELFEGRIVKLRNLKTFPQNSLSIEKNAITKMWLV